MTDTHAEIIPGLEDEPPAKEDLPSALAAAAPRRWINSATPVFLALFVLAAGLLGGVFIQRHWGTSTSTSSTSRSGSFARTGASFSPGGFPGAAGGGAAAGSSTSGTVTSVSNNTIMLTTSAGTAVTVTLSGTTKVQKPATKAELKIGQTVTVQGSTATDGSVTATSVAIS